jgi:hypothetical protein
MNREEKMAKLTRITKRLRDRLRSEYLPEAGTRRYNHLMLELFGDELTDHTETVEA